MLGGVDRVAGDQDASGMGYRDEQRLQPARRARDDDRADAAEQLLVAVDEPMVELRPVEELVGDLGMRECLLVVLPLDDDLGVGEAKVATAVIGVQVGVDDVGDVRHPEAEAVRRMVDVCGMQTRVDTDVFRRCRCGALARTVVIAARRQRLETRVPGA